MRREIPPVPKAIVLLATGIAGCNLTLGLGSYDFEHDGGSTHTQSTGSGGKTGSSSTGGTGGSGGATASTSSGTAGGGVGGSDAGPATATWAVGFANGNTTTMGGVGVDDAGNVYVTGSYQGDLKLAGACAGALKNSSKCGYLMKLDGASGACVWAVDLGATAAGTALAVSSAGEITLAATYTDALTVPGAAMLPKPQGTDAFVARYPAGFAPPGGTATWVQHLGDAGDQSVTSLALTGGGDVDVGGMYTNSLQTMPGKGLAKMGLSCKTGFVARFAAADGSPVPGVERLYVPATSCYDVGILAVATGAGDAVAVAGRSYTGVDFGEGPETNGGDWDGFFARYTSGMKYLSGAWLSTWGEQRATSVAFDGAGDLYVAGFMANTVSFPGNVQIAAQGTRGFLAHIDAQGNTVKGILLGSGDGSLRAAMLPGGDVVFAGALQGDTTVGGATGMGHGGYDVVAGRMDPGLSVVRWLHQWGDGADQGADALAVNGSGQIVVAGHYGGTLPIDGAPSPLTTPGGTGVFVAKMAP